MQISLAQRNVKVNFLLSHMEYHGQNVVFIFKGAPRLAPVASCCNVQETLVQVGKLNMPKYCSLILATPSVRSSFLARYNFSLNLWANPNVRLLDAAIAGRRGGLDALWTEATLGWEEFQNPQGYLQDGAAGVPSVGESAFAVIKVRSLQPVPTCRGAVIHTIYVPTIIDHKNHKSYSCSLYLIFRQVTL